MDEQFTSTPSTNQPGSVQSPIAPIESAPEIPTTPTQNPKPKRSKKPLIFILLAIILIAGASFGAYYWQHKKVTDQSKHITTLQNQVSDLQKATMSNQSSIVSRRAEDIANHLLVAEISYHDTKDYVKNRVVGTWFTDSFKSAVSNNTEWPTSGADPITCGNGIAPDSFKAVVTSINGDTAVTTLHSIGNGQDNTTSASLFVPQVTLKKVHDQYLGDKWLLDNYKCINNPQH